ncbi:MAG TPA: hypothetical protein VFE24_13355 [Pirellulales bacterium]|nr:hypothetical protein [Pirellulales bacterium]
MAKKKASAMKKTSRPSGAKSKSKAARPAPKKTARVAKKAPAKKKGRASAAAHDHDHDHDDSELELVTDETLLEQYDQSADEIFEQEFGKTLPFIERELDDGTILISELFWVHAVVKK